jgi:hypothetical protein
LDGRRHFASQASEFDEPPDLTDADTLDITDPDAVGRHIIDAVLGRGYDREPGAFSLTV